jgi:CheY-like chemotaxis protein
VEGLTDALTAAREAGEVSRLLLTYLGQSEGEPSVQDLSELCRRSLPILRASLPTRMELEDDLPSPGPEVEVIAGEIQQVLANLVTNAWEAVDDERAGVVRLSVSMVAPEEIPTTDRFPVGWVPRGERYSRLAVSDPGRGIEQGVIDLIFDPFFTTKEFGRGLGLSVALGSVQAHGGAIAVKTGLAGGSSVEVYLPVSAGEAPEPGGNGSETPFAARGKGTVLLVEDDDLLRKVAEKMLGRLGYTVLPARDGVEAVELFREHRERISWVLCDLIMPRMNGWDTLAALRALDPDVHVVLTSGYDEAHAPSDVPRERAQAFLGKPWTLEQLSSAAPKLGH